MFPLQTTVVSCHAALVTWVIIALNTIAFVFELSLPPDALAAWIDQFGTVPARLTGHAESAAPVVDWLSFVTSMFLHGSWLHLIANMWTFYVFGQHVEDRMGHARFAVFYVLCGLAAGATHVLVNPHEAFPAIGASGAISGVMGAYLMLFFASRVVVMIPIFFLPFFFDFPAVFYLGYWFLLQLVSGVFTLGGAGEAQGGVAFWAHVGGFVAGALTFALFLKPLRYRDRLHGDQGDCHHAWAVRKSALGARRDFF